MTRRDLIWTAAIFTGSLILGGLFVAPELFIGDSAELLGAAANLGIAHSPGYPTFTLLSHGLLGLGRGLDVSYALTANILALLSAAAGAALLWLGLREFGLSKISALIGMLVWVCGPLVTGQALTYEVHSLQHLLLGAVFLSVARATGSRRGEASPTDGLMLVLLTGLALTNHYSGAVLLPLILWGLWKSFREVGRGKKALWVGLAAAALLVPLSAYLYLPIRAGADAGYDYGMVGNLPNLWAHLTGKSYAYSFIEGGRFESALPAAGGLLSDSIPWLLWALVPLGLAEMFKRSRGLAIASLFAPLISVVILLFYRIVDPLDYLTPVIMIVAVWTAFGAEWLKRRLTERKALGTVLACIAIALSLGWWTFSLMVADRTPSGRLARMGAEDFLRELTPGSLYFGEGDDALFGPLELTAVEDFRPDVLVIDELGNLNRGPLGPVYPTLYGQVRRAAQLDFARRWAKGGGATQLTINAISPLLGAGIRVPLGLTLRLRYHDSPTLDSVNRPLMPGEPWRYSRVTGFSDLCELDTDDEHLRNGMGFPARLRCMAADPYICRVVTLTGMDPLSPLGPQLLEQARNIAPESLVSLGKIARAAYRGAVWGLCMLETGVSTTGLLDILPRWFRPTEEAIAFSERLPDDPSGSVIEGYLRIGAEAAEAVYRIRSSPESVYLLALLEFSRGNYQEARGYLDEIPAASEELIPLIDVLEVNLRLKTGGV